MKRIALLSVCLVLAGGAINAATLPQRPATLEDQIANQNLITVAASAGEFHTFLKAIDEAGLTETLQKPGPYTVFAPTDAAFAKLPPAQLKQLMSPANHDRLEMLLLHHISPMERTSAQMRTKRETLVTMDGRSVTVDGRVDGATITHQDLKAGNGVIQGVDTVLGLSQVT